MKTTTDSESSAPDSSVEAALQEAHEAMAPKQKRIWPGVLGSQILVVVVGYLFMPYFSTHLVFDQEAMAAEEARIAERARAYREQEQAERTDREIHEAHADPLKRQEREKRRQEVLAQVYELEEIARRIREERDAQLSRLMDTSSGEIQEGFETKLEDSLRKFSEAATTLKANETIAGREPFDESANELLEAASEARQKANTPSGLGPQDRESLSERLASTETTLEELRDANQDVWSGQESDELNDAQEMANLLRALPRQVKNARRQIQSAESRLEQQRNRYHDEIKKEIDRLKQSHRGVLAHQSRSPEVKELSEALKKFEAINQKQKAEKEWDQDEYEKSFKTVKESAEGAKEHIKGVRELGDQRETLALSGLLSNQQRQADAQLKQWQQLEKKQAGESKKSREALTAVADQVAKQWEKTKSQLSADDQKIYDKATGGLLKEARKQIKTPSAASAQDVKAKADQLAAVIRENPSENQQVKQDAARLEQAVQLLAGEVEKSARGLRQREEETKTLARKIEEDLKKTQKQLNDQARRAALALTKNNNGKPPEGDDPEALKKVAEGLRKIDEQAKTFSGDPGNDLAARSKALTALRKDTQTLNQTQKTLQNGITKDESNKLDRSLTSLEKSLGRRHAEFTRQAAASKQNTERQEEQLQKSIDQVKAAASKARNLKSPEAKGVAATLQPVPKTAPAILAEENESRASLEKIAKAEEQTKDWLQRAKGEAPVRQLQMANTRQTLRDLSEAMTEAGLTRQNADAAVALLEEGPLEFPDLDPASLEDAVATAESLHELIEDDFQTVRAAEIAARTGRSFEEMQRLADSLSEEDSQIEVPDSDPQVETVGDLREYRKAMDKTVAQTESLTQNARTLERQALGEGDSGLAQALANAQSQGTGQGNSVGSPMNVGVDPRRRKDRKPSNTWHQMTFEDVHIPTGRIDLKKVKAEALPGRRFTDESLRRGWLYVDTWYIIGPWENFGKINWGNVHAPELEIDLAKSYRDGKGGRELRWQFTQHPAIRCDVPDETTNSSYYAYTELYFDKPREMLVAIASNDAGKLWIDGEVVWQDNGLSSWNLDEGFRRVRFKKGYSKILMRVENGPRTCEFSLLLCPPDL